METSRYDEKPNIVKRAASGTVFPILVAISLSHLLNDTMQSVIPAIYPLIKQSFRLNFAQIGLITFTFQTTASLFQPLVGTLTDRRPQPFSLAIGMGFSMAGLILLSVSSSFELLLVSVGLVGLGSSIFHPESSRVAHMAAGGRRGFAQSFFQVGGNTGQSLGPLLAALVFAARGGHTRIIWFALLALAGMVILARVGVWYRANLHRIEGRGGHGAGEIRSPVSGGVAAFSVSILLVLIFSKFFYLASMTSYFTFYLMSRFNVSVQASQLHLFLFQFAVAAGTLIGGPLGDRYGRKYVIWFSILGVAPFTLALPFVNLLWTSILSVIIGVILASAMPAILVYAQELFPGKVGMISGLFFGFAFGMGGIGSAVLGALADRTSIDYVYHVCSFLPLIGLLTAFLPNIERRRPRAAAQ